VRLEINSRTAKLQKKFGVDRTTLSRRHKGAQASNKAKSQDQQLLNPQQEDELVGYIETCTRDGLPPTRGILKNFGSAVAQSEVSESWITRFQHRHPDELITKWDTGIDRERHLADSKHKYELYFNLLHSKMREHGIDERNTYNMDEKGFFVGIAKRTKRIFSKAVWESKERTATMRDGNREWITLLACVCASGDALPPALIYQGTSGFQSSWVDDLLAEQHQVFVSHSASGWSNNDLGLAWLQQVFERYTAAKARRQWRLLILDGHASHLTPDFLEYCEAKRIMVMVYPPHSTHSLQPLDVVLFSPLSKHYTEQLTQQLQRTQGLSRITKRDFFGNFWPAWSSTMTHDLILKSFQATGVWPMDADQVLQRFNNDPQQQDDEPGIREQGDGDTWPQLRKILTLRWLTRPKLKPNSCPKACTRCRSTTSFYDSKTRSYALSSTSSRSAR
jgi:hypothetical protein